MSDVESEQWQAWEEEAGEEEDIAKSLFCDKTLPISQILEYDRLEFDFDLRAFAAKVRPPASCTTSSLHCSDPSHRR